VLQLCITNGVPICNHIILLFAVALSWVGLQVQASYPSHACLPLHCFHSLTTLSGVIKCMLLLTVTVGCSLMDTLPHVKCLHVSSV